MQHSSYWQPGLGCHNLPINWFDQFIPAARQKELNDYVRTVGNTDMSLATALEDTRTHLKLPPQEPVPTLEVLQHLLAPALQRRATLANQPQPVFANIVACLDRSQCPILKHTQLINDLAAHLHGPTGWTWEWRASEFAKAVEHIEREPPLPRGSGFHSLETLFVVLKEVGFMRLVAGALESATESQSAASQETSPLCGGSDTRFSETAGGGGGEARGNPSGHPDYDQPAVRQTGRVDAWSSARLDVLRSFARLSLAYLRSEKINIACTILNGTKAISLHSHRLEKSIEFKTTANDFLLGGFKSTFVNVTQPYIRTITLHKSHQTWAARFSQAQLSGFVASHRALLTQSLSRLVECIALRFAITHALLTVLKQGGVVRLGGTVVQGPDYNVVVAAVKLCYPLKTLYESLGNYLNSHLTPIRPACPYTTLLEEIGITDAEELTQSQLLARIRTLTIYRPSAEDSAHEPVTTAALKEAILNGSLSGEEFARYCLDAGYTKEEILKSLRSMRDLALDDDALEDLIPSLNAGQAEELLRQLSID